MASMLRAHLALLIPAAITLTIGSTSSEVHAEKKKPAGAGRACVIKGETEVDKDLKIYAKASGDDVIAKFTGIETALKVTDFPRDKDGRIWVETGLGREFRIEGWVDGDQIPMYTKNVIPVKTGHVWINEKREVRFDGSRPGKLKIKKVMKSPVAQTFRGWSTCNNLTLTQGVPPGAEIDGDARGYLMRKDSVVLYDDYGRDKEEVLTLYKSVSGNQVVFWSSKVRGSYVQVAYQGEILIEAWVKRYDLKRLPKGELYDQQRGPKKGKTASSLKLQGNPKVIKVKKELKILSEAKKDATVLGRVEKDAEVYVVDIVAGYASVMPKPITVMPAKDKQFWVDAKELGADKPAEAEKKDGEKPAG